MAKISDMQQFRFTTLNGEDVLINCWTYSYSRGWGHRACLVYVGDRFINAEKRITYYNRTWEAFKYESMLNKMIYTYFNKADQKFLNMQVKAIADNEAAQAEAWFNSFVKKYNALSDSTKEKIKNSDILLNSKDEADAFINSALLLDSLN